MNRMHNGFAFNHEATFARMREEAKDRRDREERAQERVIDHLRLDMTSLGQQFTGMSVISTFVASIVVALISLVNELSVVVNAGSDPNSTWSREQIYLMWYLALVYSLTTAIASGASAVFAFARANGRLDGDAQRRVEADRVRMGRMMRGYAICFALAVALLFIGLLFFVWVSHDRWLTLLVGAAVLPLWSWVIWQAYGEWRSMTGGRTWRSCGEIPWSSWSMSRWRKKEDKEKDDKEVV